MIPLFHDVEGKRVLVVGGGSVARRRARRFVPAAEVTVVAPEFVDGFAESCDLVRRELPPEATRETLDEVIPGDGLDGTFLVVVATDDTAVNDAVAAAADEAGCLVNRADETGDVVVPSRIESAEISVALSTRGASPATTKYLRQELTPLIEEADGMVQIQRTLRAELKETMSSQQERKRRLRAVLDSPDVWDLLPDDPERAMTLARDIVEE
ncbi:precorrin-2 dehydrogenase/sirohydrochlorin ferrochelatase family protein [Halovenus salina]|uniref:precorrin-2 dehydrogenase n=1 Tax=Halovenus salina TaxID=1510225 RepID=A0ABD5W2M0_9EURY|nr:bifunctional precorrin-2 dehydrogenase/sirohydrochlorin ferrochelatase [Halovenus salina]